MNTRSDPGRAGPPTPDRGADRARELDADLDVDLELARGDDVLGTSLRSLLSPPPDIEGRVADQVSQHLIGRSAAGTALDLLGLGVRTFMTFLSEDPSDADRFGESPDHGPGRDDDRRATT